MSEATWGSELQTVPPWEPLATNMIPTPDTPAGVSDLAEAVTLAGIAALADLGQDPGTQSLRWASSVRWRRSHGEALAGFGRSLGHGWCLLKWRRSTGLGPASKLGR